MPNNVLLIGEKGAPLTCAEADSNYLALLDRGNHTGVQSASTIYDLSSTISALPNIQNIESNITQLTSQVNDLQEQVLGQDGHVSYLIQQASSLLGDDIADLRTLIESNTTSITHLVAEDTAIHTEIDQLREALEDDVNHISDTLQCLEDGTCLLVPSPPDEQGDLFLGYDDETNALIWGLPISLFCGPLVEEAFPVGKHSSVQLGTLEP